MKRTPTAIDLAAIPCAFHSLLEGASVFDSSCSPEARVYFIDKGCGYFLKTAPKESLAKEAVLGKYFHQKGMSAPVLLYLSEEKDWLLSERVLGEDATHQKFLAEPKRLADLMGSVLRELHECACEDCPVQDRLESYFPLAEQNYNAGKFDLSYGTFASAEEAFRVLKGGRSLLKSDTLIHGDFCLPNFLFDDWRFSGFIDLGNGGVGDRHIDLYWGAWSLCFNLKTDAFRERFFEAYGKDRISKEALRVVAAAEVFG